jgi:poly(A) polymerase
VQARKLAITRKIAGDIKDIWAIQPRFEKRAGHAPYRLIEQPRYRAGWDFLRLRAQAGEIDMALVDWWDAFAGGSQERRETLIREAPAGEAAPRKRRRRRKPNAKPSEPADAA